MTGACLNVMFSLLVVGAGVGVALQQVLNANLRMELGSPWWAGFISYFVGMVVMLAIAITSGEPRFTEAMATRTYPGLRGQAESSVRFSSARRSLWYLALVPRQCLP